MRRHHHRHRHAAGYRYVGRYLGERPSSNPPNKRTQPGELDTTVGSGSGAIEVEASPR
ncbi:MAG TPA: hypothetical protein VGD29_03150 [Actinoplanes sp.]